MCTNSDQLRPQNALQALSTLIDQLKISNLQHWTEMAHTGPIPFRLGKLFLSQNSYFVLPNSCHCHFCSTLFWQLLLLQLLVAFNKTVHKMYLNISITTFVSFFHSHQFVFDMVWFLSCRLFLYQNLTSRSFQVY